jgi:hypothetical protein
MPFARASSRGDPDQRAADAAPLVRRFHLGVHKDDQLLGADVAGEAGHGDQRRDLELSRTEMMRAYAETGDSRRRVILEPLGELPEPCGNYDNGYAGESRTAVEGPFGIGIRVRHKTWGEGTCSGARRDGSSSSSPRSATRLTPWRW